MIFALESSCILRLAGARGVALEVLEGHVWITEAGRGEDAFLARGASYEVAGDGIVLVEAEKRARLSVRPRASWGARLRGRWRRWRLAREARAAARQLEALSDHRLRDLGLARGEIESQIYSRFSR